MQKEKPKAKPVKPAATTAVAATAAQLAPFIASAAWTGPKRGYVSPQLHTWGACVQRTQQLVHTRGVGAGRRRRRRGGV